MGTFDNASWHDEVPREQALTHIAMFMGWAISRDLISHVHLDDPSSAWYIARIRARERSSRDFLVDLCRNRIAETDLTPEGCAFAASYYAARYMSDYARVFFEDPLYDVAETWDNFDRIAAILDRRLEQWRRWRERQGIHRAA